MNKDKAVESVNEIKELMEKSSKFISLSGLAAIMAGIYALVGAYIATQVITTGTHLMVALELMAIIASLVLVAAAVTACILSYYKSKKTGQKFFSRLTYRALWNFSLPMLTGGVLCISILMHEYYDILASVMLLFYGLALVNVSKFTYSSIVWLGYAFICLGIVDCFWEGHSLLFWTIGFGGFHVYVRSTAAKMKEYLRYGQIVVDVAKGIEEQSLMTMSQVIEEELPLAEVAVLSGPSHAEEVSRGLPTTCVVQVLCPAVE